MTLSTSRLPILRQASALGAIFLFLLSAFIFLAPHISPKLVRGPTAEESTSTTTIAIREQIAPSSKASGLPDPSQLPDNQLTGAWFIGADAPAEGEDPSPREAASKEQVLKVDIRYPQSMLLNETPTVDFSLTAKEEGYDRALFIKLSSAGFKIDPGTPVELKSSSLPMHQTWSISPNSEGKHTLVLSLSAPVVLGFAKINDEPVPPMQTFKLPITVYTIYGIPLWMVNTLGAFAAFGGTLAALGGTAVAWGPFANWVLRKPASRTRREQHNRRSSHQKKAN